MIGVGSALLTRYVASNHSLSGLPSSLPFIVLFVVLVAAPPKGRPDARAFRRRPAASTKRLPRPAAWGGAAALALLVLAVPELVGTKLPVYTNAATFVLIFVSLALLVWTSTHTPPQGASPTPQPEAAPH